MVWIEIALIIGTLDAIFVFSLSGFSGIKQGGSLTFITSGPKPSTRESAIIGEIIPKSREYCALNWSD